jgi:hypothetical protein
MEKCDVTRRVLEYCRDALDEIKKEEPTGAPWERRWASLMALLRTACETLKRDAPTWWQSKIYAPNAAVKGKKNWCPDIFGPFIWTDANLFLHEGKLTTGQSAAVPTQGAAAYALAGGQQPPPVPPPAPLPKVEISYHMNTGFYAGRDARDVADEAISWLQQQIDGAER